VVQNAVTGVLSSYCVIMQTDVLRLAVIMQRRCLGWLIDCMAVEIANRVQCLPTFSGIGMQLDVIPQLLLFGLLDMLGRLNEGVSTDRRSAQLIPHDAVEQPS
jgi:hypothetical protein